MISNKTIIFAATALATTNALTIEAQVEAEGILNWGGIDDAFKSAWDWTKGAGESAYKWTKSAAYDVGDAFESSYDWMSKGENWDALGKTWAVAMD